jgi:hypothetical protein
MRFSFFRDVTWRIFVVNYRRFGATHFQGYNIHSYTLEDGIDRLSRNAIYAANTSQNVWVWNIVEMSDGRKLKYKEEKARISQLVDHKYHIISLRRSLICAVSFLEILSNVCVKKKHRFITASLPQNNVYQQVKGRK